MAAEEESAVNDMVIASQDVVMEIDYPIGRGGFGTVYRGQHETYGTVAVKTLVDNGVIPARHSQDLKREARRLMDVSDHPSIINLLGVIMERNNYSLVLEYMLFGSVSQFLKDFQVAMPLRVRMIQQVVSAMEYLHSHEPPIFHLDLKADNVLIDNQINAKICDFGLSVWKTVSATITRGFDPPTSRQCTVTHVPPEVWMNVNLPGNAAYDIYGFGITMWEILSGEIPYRGSSNSLIERAVIKNQRPDMNALKPGTAFQFKHMMARCWHGQASLRPAFSVLKMEILPLYLAVENKMVESMKDIRQQICGKYMVNDHEYTETEYIDDLEDMESDDEDEGQEQENPASYSPICESVAMETDAGPTIPEPLANEEPGLAPAPAFYQPTSTKEIPLPRTQLTPVDNQIRKILRDPLCMMMLNSGLSDKLFLAPAGRKIMENRDEMLKYINADTELKLELERSNHPMFYHLNGARVEDSNYRGTVEEEEKKKNDYFHNTRYSVRKAEKDKNDRERRRDRALAMMRSCTYGKRLYSGGRGQKLLKTLKTPYHLQEAYEDTSPGTGGAEKFEMIDPKVIEDCKDPILLQIVFGQDQECLDTMMRGYGDVLMKMISENKTNYKDKRDNRGWQKSERRDIRMMDQDMDVHHKMKHMEMEDRDEPKSFMHNPVMMKKKEPILSMQRIENIRDESYKRDHYMSHHGDLERMRPMHINDLPKRSRMEEEQNRKEIMRVLPQVKSEQTQKKNEEIKKQNDQQLKETERKLKKEEERKKEEKQKKDEEKKKNDEKRRKEEERRKKEEGKRREEKPELSGSQSSGLLGSVLGIFNRKSQDKMVHYPMPEMREMDYEIPDMGRSVQSMDVVSLEKDPVPSTSVSYQSLQPLAPGSSVHLVTSKMVTSKGPAHNTTASESLRQPAAAKPPSPVASPKMDRAADVKVEPGNVSPKREKMDVDPHTAKAMPLPAEVMPQQPMPGGATARNEPVQIVHKHAGGSFTKMTMSGNMKNMPNMQIGEGNMMVFGVASPKHADDEEMEESRKQKKKKKTNKKKVKLTTSEDPVNKDSIDLVCTDIGKDWRKLGRQLDLSDAEIDQIHQDYNLNGMYEVIYQMLHRWLQRKRQGATLKALAQALHDIDRDDVAGKVK